MSHEDGLTKHWYYLFFAYYIWLNKSYTLTDEQAKFINDLHDLKIPLEGET